MSMSKKLQKRGTFVEKTEKFQGSTFFFAKGDQLDISKTEQIMGFWEKVIFQVFHV
jgi:hypothetical protein